MLRVCRRRGARHRQLRASTDATVAEPDKRRRVASGMGGVVVGLTRRGYHRVDGGMHMSVARSINDKANEGKTS